MYPDVVLRADGRSAIHFVRTSSDIAAIFVGSSALLVRLRPVSVAVAEALSTAPPTAPLSDVNQSRWRTGPTAVDGAR